jgi:hypothetical protein
MVELVAAMLRSALVWEAEHGGPPQAPETTGENLLQDLPDGIHYPAQDQEPPIRLIKGGQRNGDVNAGTV